MAPSAAASTPRQRRDSEHGGNGGASSPLFYPSSSSPARSQRSSTAAATPRQAYARGGGNAGDNEATPRMPHQLSSSGIPSSMGHRAPAATSSPLFFPPSSPAHSRVGDPFRQPVAISRLGSDAPTLSAATVDDDAFSGSGNGITRVIWGTNINIVDAMNAFKQFLRGFKTKYRMTLDGNPVAHGQGEEQPYLDRVQEMIAARLTIMNVDARDLESYPASRRMARQLQTYPSEMIPLMDQALKDTLLDTMPSDVADEEVAEVERSVYKVRPWNLQGGTVNMRELNPADIDKLVSIKGLVIRTSSIIPDMKQAFFRCSVCHHTVTVDVDRGRINEPTRCPRSECNTANSMQLVHNRSLFCDKQVIRLQETPDSVPAGQTPHSVNLVCHDELVDVVRAGDRVCVTGVFKSDPVRVNPRQRTIKSLFRTSIDVVHVLKTDRKRVGLDASTLDQAVTEQDAEQTEDIRPISDEEVRRIHETAARSDCYELLARSLAPSIYEMEDVKKGVLLQLFGGTNKIFTRGGSPRYRGDINVLLCGDPSTSKSQLLQYVHNIAPRGIYTSGKGSSAVGLTAYVTRDPDTRQLVLESGALVLSDGGVCCIDEFDKMSDSTRAILHEVMEQQTVTIAKAGIITTLNARTSILASANPIGSRYDANLPVTRNIDLPPTLLSRFDLVYLMLDRVDETADRRLARHIVGMYVEDVMQHAAAGDSNASHEILPVEFLTSYISYARTHIHPTLTEAASRALVKHYVEMRKLGEDVRAAERRITATTRQLESMIRLAEAFARMRLSREVLESDVAEAARLIRSAIKDYATDPATGKISLDLIYMADAPPADSLLRELEALVGQVTQNDPLASISVTNLIARFREQSSVSVSAASIEDALEQLQRSGKLAVVGTGSRRMVRALARRGAPALA